MKPIHFLILALFLAFAIAGCTRSIAPAPELPPTAEIPAEAAPPAESSNITVITPPTEGEAPVISEVVTGTLAAPGSVPVLCAFPPEWVPYTIQESDTLDSLALYFGVEPGDISTANCLYAAGIPLPGQTIYLPSAPAGNGNGETAGGESQPSGTESQPSSTESQAPGTESQAGGTESQTSGGGEGESSGGDAGSQAKKKADCKSPYTVRSGEWVYKIARRCNISPYAIIAYNQLAWPYWLRPGQVLLLPKNAPPFPGN